jgi:hypothetical protein
LGARTERKFAQDVFNVTLSRVQRDDQLIRNLPIVEPAREQSRDFLLGRGERRRRTRGHHRR